MTRYLERLFSDASERLTDRFADRLADRIAPKVAQRLPGYESYIATLDVLVDEEALTDLRTSARDSDSDLVDYETVRREVGLA